MGRPLKPDKPRGANQQKPYSRHDCGAVNKIRVDHQRQTADERNSPLLFFAVNKIAKANRTKNDTEQ